MTTGAGLPGAPLKLSPPLLLNTLDDVLKHVSLVARTAVAVPSSIERSQLRPPSLITEAPLKRTIADSIMKTPASLSNPQLVAMRRDYFRRLAKAKLLNTPDAPAIEAYLKRLDKELARRKITIQNPELN